MHDGKKKWIANEENRRGFLSAVMLGGIGAGVGEGVMRESAAKAEVEGECDRNGEGDGAAKRRALNPDGAPAAASGYSPGIEAEGGRVVFVSGQGPSDLNVDVETQIRQTFDRVGLVLKSGGATFENVVMIRAYFVHLVRDLPIYRKVRLDYLKAPYPAATAVGVTELAVPGLQIEIEAVAIV